MSFYELRLCETREYSPRLLDHWLHTQQKNKRPLEFLIQNHQGKVHLFCSEDLSIHLPGSRSKPCERPKLQAPQYFVEQRKGPLLPIKRYSQFEDRVQKTQLIPLDSLLPLLAQTPNGYLYLRYKPFSNHRRERIVRKAKKIYFEPERRFDQWESRAWLSWKPRRFLGPLLRRFFLHTPLKVMTSEQMESLHEREDPRRAMLDKLSRPLFEVEFSMSHPFKSFIHGFTLPYLGALNITKKTSDLLLSAEELATLLSMPQAKEQARYLNTEPTAYLPAPPEALNLKVEDRKRHLYLVGKTGMGKSTALLNLFAQDLEEDRSIVVLDPHGDLVEDASRLVPENRLKDLILLDPSNENYPLALNPLELHSNERAPLKTSALVEMFEVLAQGSWGPRLEYILRNALLLLTLVPNTTLLDLPRLLTNETKCRELLRHVQDFELQRFFQYEFLALDSRTRQDYVAPILNKVGPLLTLPVLRNIFGQPKSRFSFNQAFAQKKIVLISLSKGKLGEDASRMLGMVFISMIQSTLLARAALPLEQREPVCLTIDEFQNFTTRTLLSMLSESRKYGLALTLANQYLTQIPEEHQDAVLGNAGSLLCFRSSYADAQVLAPSLGLVEEDLTQLKPFQCYAKLLKDQNQQALFSLEIQKPNFLRHAAPQVHSFERFGKPRLQVEEKLKKRYNGE